MVPNPYKAPASESPTPAPSRSWLIWLAVAVLGVPLVVAIGFALILLVGFLLIVFDGLEGIQ